MNDCYLNLLVSFRALFSADPGANLVNSKQTIGIILPDLSLLGYAVPVESFGIGLFVILFAYLIIEYNVQLLSHEKFKIAMNMLHTAHTPLILLRNQLEESKLATSLNLFPNKWKKHWDMPNVSYIVTRILQLSIK